MVDTVDSVELINENGRYVVRLLAISDGTGESGVAKVDISGLTTTRGVAPIAADIQYIEFDIQGYTSIRLYWDHTTDDEALMLSANGDSFDFRRYGGLRDPRSAGGTGDIILTTNGHSSGDTYSILLDVILRSE